MIYGAVRIKRFSLSVNLFVLGGVDDVSKDRSSKCSLMMPSISLTLIIVVFALCNLWKCFGTMDRAAHQMLVTSQREKSNSTPTWVFPPVLSWTMLRDMEQLMVKHWKIPPMVLLRPSAMSSYTPNNNKNVTIDYLKTVETKDSRSNDLKSEISLKLLSTTLVHSFL